MPSDTVTLRMEGDIPLHAYASTVGCFDDLVDALTREIAPGVPIDWTLGEVTSLPDSAQTTAYGNAPEREPVHHVAQGYLAVGQALEQGSLIPYAKPVQHAANQMRQILNGRIRQLVFETADNEATVRAAPAVQVAKRREIVTQGAVTGRIQTMTNRGSLRFTLFDVVHDRAVSCYLAEGREDVMLGVWGKVAVVEGIVRRDPDTGRPMSIRNIRDVTIRLEGDPNAYLEARGVVPGPFLMTAQEAIRRIRDG